MTQNELLYFITKNNITSKTVVNINYSENGLIISGRFQIEFFLSTNQPAISNGRVGVRREIILDTPFQPVLGGLLIESIIQISILI